jgi:hypothetical protein
MKNFLLLTCFLSLQLLSYGQANDLKIRKINAQYHYSNVGANLAVSYQFNFKKIEPFVGAMYHVNMFITDNRSFAYRHRFYNKNFVDGLGVNFGFTKPIRIKNSNLGLYFLFINQASHMHNRTLHEQCDTSSIYIVNYVYSFSAVPFWILENTVGLGINVKAYNNFYFNASAAVGIATYFARSSRRDNYGRTSEINDNFRVGISYLIPQRPKKEK